jgi:hypothetical protein
MNIKLNKFHVLFLLILAFALAFPTWAQASTPDPLLGNWLADWESAAGYYGNFRFEIITGGSDYYAIMYIPDLGVMYETWPVDIYGEMIVFGGMLVGEIVGDTIQGQQVLPVPYPPYYDQINWQATRMEPQVINIDPGPGPECADLPQLLCTGSAENCSELVPFDPDYGVGYIDYPVNGETWDNQYRSYIRRDLMQLVDYATAKLQCKTAGWEFGSHAPLGLVDMSEADGSIPGTSIGSPGHPPGTHEGGRDIDLAYYQFSKPDNRSRVVCDHHLWDEVYGIYDAYHCTADPYLLDPWRTALFTAYMSEHPLLRVIGVDGKVGPLLDDSLDWFIANGWIDPEFRDFIPLFYEETDEGYGFFRFHHHHMHVSMNPVEPVLLSLDVKPETLNLNSNGKYITAYIELVEGYDPSLIETVAATVDGYSIFFAEMDKSDLGDYDEDGIPDLMVKFDRQVIQSQLSTGWAEVTLYGVVDDALFQGSDLIWVNRE